MSPTWFALWWPAFLVTILSEAPIIALCVRDRIGVVNGLALGVALQCVTHPLFWLSWAGGMDFFYAHYTLSTVGFEAVIYLVEAALIWAVLPPRRAGQRLPNVALGLIASACANTVSLVIGILSER